MKIENNVLVKVYESDIQADGSLIIPDGITEIGNIACSYRSFKSIYIPDSVKKIGKSAFFIVVIWRKLTFLIA